MEPHRCRLSYESDGHKKIEIINTRCDACNRNLNWLRESGDDQLEIESIEPFKRRLKFRNYAMLPVFDEESSKNRQLGLPGLQSPGPPRSP